MDREIRSRYDPINSERAIKELWEEKKIYERAKEARAKGKDLYFLDSLHTTADTESTDVVYSILVKDAIIRYLRMRGYNVKDNAGFEGYVAEAEHRAREKMGIESEEDIENLGREKYLNACRKEAKEIRDEISEFFRDLGVWLEWRHSYTPLDNKYVEGVWYAFKSLNEKGLLDRFRGVSHWCPHCNSFLSRSEIKKEVEWKRGVYVKFPIKGKRREYFVVWFSEPWRLTATLALEVIPSKKYAVVEIETRGEKIILGRDEMKNVLKDSGITKYQLIGEISGKDLVGHRYVHPLFGTESEEGIIGIEDIEAEQLNIDRVIAGRAGGLTGIKAVVPAHSGHDLILAERNDISVMTPLDNAGELGADTGKYAGFNVFDAESIIIRDLVNTGMALSTYDIREGNRYCSRCNHRLIPRISEEWAFKPAETGTKTEEMVSEIEWSPAWMIGPDYEWMQESPPIPISRKGYWGVPMPVWTCSCGHKEVVGSAKEFEEKSSTFKAGMGLQRPWIDRYVIKCPKCGKDMKRGEEILSQEFVAAAASWGQLHYPAMEGEFHRWWPPDLLVEPVKRGKGWIYLQMSISGAIFGKKPFKKVVGTGKVDTSRLSTDKLFELRNRYGVDALRYAILRVNHPWINRNLGKEWFERVKRLSNTLWNIHRFAVINYGLSGFRPEEVSLDIVHEYGLSQDKWLISFMEGTKEKYMENMDRFLLDEAMKEVEKLVYTISKWYIGSVRIRIKSRNLDRREVMAGYRTLHEALMTSIKLMAPFTPYLSDIIYRDLGGGKESIHEETLEPPNRVLVDKYLEVRMDIAMDIIRSGRIARRKAGISLRWPLERIVIKALSREVVEAADIFGEFIKESLNIKRIEVVPPATEWEEMILEVHPNPDAIGMVYRQWSSRIAVMLRNRPAKKIREGIEKGEYYLGIEGQLVKILPNMVQFISRLPDYVVEHSFLDGKVYLDIRRNDSLMVEGRVREIIRRVQDMRKDMNLNFGDYINLYIAGNESIEGAVETWGEEIAEATRAQEITLTNEEGIEGEYIVEWYIEGEKVTIGITPLYWEEMVSAFSRIPGITRQKAETMFDAGYINLDALLGAKEDELTQIPGITQSLARKILSHMHKNFSEGAELIQNGKEYQCSACGATMETPEQICPKCHLPLHIREIREEPEEEKEEEVPEVREEDRKEEFIEAVAGIKGIGPSKARALYKAGYHSIEDLKRASVEELAKVPKLSLALAEMIKNEFGYIEAEKREEEKLKAEKEKEVRAPEAAPEERREMSQDEFVKEISKIKGIGPSKARALYKAGYHSIDDLRKASVDDLAKIKRFSRALAEMIKENYGSEPGREVAEEKEKEEEKQEIVWEDGRFYVFNDVRDMYSYAKSEETSRKILYLTKEGSRALKSKYGLKAENAFHISNIAKSALRPNELDRIALKIQKFASKGGEKIVITDSFDQLVSNNSFESVLNFINALKEDFRAKKCMLVLSINMESLDKNERRQIEDKADGIL